MEPEPLLEAPVRSLDGSVTGALLLAHGGKERSHKPVPARNGPVLRMRAIGRAVAPHLAEHGIAVHLLRFRYQGWNDDERSPVSDVRWAARRLAQLYGDVPLVLTGHSLGGRAVVNAADAENVVGVLGLAPWLPATEPTEQLSGRRLLLAHGTQDRVTSPRSSLEFTMRAREDGFEAARIELPGSGHTLLKRARDWNRLVLAFAYGCLATPTLGAPRQPRYTRLISGAFADQGPNCVLGY